MSALAESGRVYECLSKHAVNLPCVFLISLNSSPIFYCNYYCCNCTVICVLIYGFSITFVGMQRWRLILALACGLRFANVRTQKLYLSLMNIVVRPRPHGIEIIVLARLWRLQMDDKWTAINQYPSVICLHCANT